jgi:hypothetical protein
MTQKNGHGIKESMAEHKAAVGLGLAAIVAAAAGAYYLYGNDKGTQRRRKLKSWALRMKADVMEQIEELRDVNEEAYHKVVDGIADKYRQLKNVDPADVAELAARMRMHWKDIQRDISSVTGNTSRRAASSPTRRAKTVRARRPKSSTKKTNGSSTN